MFLTLSNFIVLTISVFTFSKELPFVSINGGIIWVQVLGSTEKKLLRVVNKVATKTFCTAKIYHPNPYTDPYKESYELDYLEFQMYAFN